MQEMLEEYVAELAEALRDLRQVRESLARRRCARRAVPLPVGGRRLGLDYFAAETRHTRRALARLAKGPVKRER